MRILLPPVSFLAAIVLAGCSMPGPRSAPASLFRQTDASFMFLANQQDLFARELVIYDDRDSGACHFSPSGWMGDLVGVSPQRAALIFDDNCRTRPHSGSTCIRLTYPDNLQGEGWIGIRWQAVEGGWSGPGYDLARYAKADQPFTLTFWVRGERGGERATFLIGGTDGDSFPAEECTVVATATWSRVTLSVPANADLRSVASAFGWTADQSSQGGRTIYVDDVRLSFGPTGTAVRLAEPRFVRSYVPESRENPDRYFRNAAYLYDNALMVLAWCCRANPDDLRRAGLVCDAMVWAQAHDPEYSDGRLRNAYSCGDLADVRRHPRLPGWWDDQQTTWMQDPYAASTDCGNMAWAGLALLTYWQSTGSNPDSVYLKAAERLGRWVDANAYSEAGPGGYSGGVDLSLTDIPGHKVGWKSTEHNIDLFVLFERLAAATSDDVWRSRAQHARAFVERMIDRHDGGFYTGTEPDGASVVHEPRPLDVAPWSLLAFRDRATFGPAVEWASRHCWVHGARGPSAARGYDFNTDLDGVWWEGTAQMHLAFLVTGNRDRADQCLRQLREHGKDPGNPGAVFAASIDGLTTGFQRLWGPWVYWHRPHAGGATCWYVFAESKWNPYWGLPVQPNR